MPAGHPHLSPPMNPRLTLVTVAIAASALLSSGCRRDGLLVDGPMAALAVHGSVTLSDGAPAPGARVEAEARAGCDGGLVAADATTSDAAGGYHLWVLQWGTRFEACLRVRALPPAGSAAAPDSATVTRVELRAERPDSIRVDLRLPGS
jgi:hypothetical protein